ncbi:hypothetical protein V1264_022787 [Littorina saxatilis]|uniref:Reelin domain-containing protein n=2 Tax=Littorina saxatilis TaxID=31220 RepID=A0AAN9B6X3_9CAEN
MSDVTLLSCVILLTLAVSGVHGYPTGAPLTQCADMTPQHGVAARPIIPSIPYSVTMSKNTYYSGERHTVMVMGGNSQFKGLMLQARDANGQRVGTFSLSPGDLSLKLLDCGGVAGTAVTHTGRNLKNSVTVTWTAPMMDMGSVTFR